MSEQGKGETPAVLTPRLVFDSGSVDEVVPQFLKGRVIEPREPGDPIEEPEKPFAEIDEPDDMGDHSNSVEEAMTEGADNPTGSDGSSDRKSDEELDEMSVEDLERLQDQIAARKKAKQEAEKRAVIEQIVDVVNTYKIPVEELVDALGGLKVKRKGVKAKPKYQDPASGAIWSGRGKEPAWIRGKNRKPFLIDQ